MDNPLLANIETSRSLPTLPHILLQLIDICNQEEKGIRDLSKVINKDPSISERLLRLVNSAYYSLKQKITSIDQALLLLGMDAVKNIALSSSVYQVFHRPGRKSAFNLKMFWWHSLSCASIARRLAIRIQYPAPAPYAGTIGTVLHYLQAGGGFPTAGKHLAGTISQHKRSRSAGRKQQFFPHFHLLQQIKSFPV